MKRVLIGIAAIFLYFEGVYVLAVYQPRNLGWVTLSVSSGTLTEIINSTAPTNGYVRFCTNCASGGGAGAICISTASATWGQFILSTGTRCQ